MKNSILVTLLCLLAAGTAVAQSHRAAMPRAPLHASTQAVLPGPEDLVVGFPNPNEVRVLDTPLEVNGDVIVLNNGRLRVQSTELRVRGNVYILNNGGVELAGSELRFVQEYLYQRSILLRNTASLWLAGGTLDCGGYNVGCAVMDSAVLRLDASSVTNAVMTTSVTQRARMEATDCDGLGEVLLFDQARANYLRCSALLSWLHLPAGANATMRLPGADVLGRWVFPDSIASHAGIGTQWVFEECVNLRWALMIEAASEALVTDADLLAVGLMFYGPGPATVSGLVNNSALNDYALPVSDRNIRFQRSRVGAWNLYALGTAELAVNNSVFGEILSMGRGNVTVTSSICDGSGGYVGSQDSSRMQFIQSSIRAPVLARGVSQWVGIQSGIQNFTPRAADNGVLALFHCTFPALPEVGPGAVAAVIGIDEPSQAPVNALVPVYGTVRFLPGADVPVYFTSYWLDVLRADEPEAPIRVSQPSIRQRYRDTLCVWDTSPLLPGAHILRVHMRISSEDTIVLPWAVQLTRATSVELPAVAASPRIAALYPQPASVHASVAVDYEAPRDGTLDVYDALGSRVYSRAVPSGSGTLLLPAHTLPAGMYLLRLIARDEAATTLLHIR